MTRPRLLDLFRGQGGASEGYIRAGWDVFGVDLDPRVLRRGPGSGVHSGDALAVLRTLLAGRTVQFSTRDGGALWLGLWDFAAIHASPPCQGYTIATAGNLAARAKYDRLIAVTRDLLVATERPWVIENVELARSEMVDPIMLCGRMFGLTAPDGDGVTLTLERHRLFESNVELSAPHHPADTEGPGEFTAGVYGGSRRAPTRYRITSPDGLMVGVVEKLPAKWRKRVPAGWSVEKITPASAEDRFAARISRGGGYVPRSIAVQQQLLGIDWMTVKGMQESIPPVYAQHVGMQLLAAVEERAA